METSAIAISLWDVPRGNKALERLKIGRIDVHIQH